MHRREKKRLWRAHFATPLKRRCRMIDRNAMSLSAAARRLPGRNGHHANPSTVARWVHKGALDPQGRRVKLAAVRMGSTLFVTEQALTEFLTALNGEPAATEPVVRSPNARRRASEEAARQLEAMGA